MYVGIRINTFFLREYSNWLFKDFVSFEQRNAFSYDHLTQESITFNIKIKIKTKS